MAGERVLAIVVTYHPDPTRLAALLSALAPQVEQVLVVDNTPQDGEWRGPLEAAGIRVHALGANRGIAAAQNVGIATALGEGFDHVLFSDQDSIAEAGMVEQLLAVARARRDAGDRVGSVCPAYYDEVTGQAFRLQVQAPGRFFYSTVPASVAEPWAEIIVTISSGSLVPSEALREVGGMREDFFIDHVDTEWCHRARAHGFRNFATHRARLMHRFGDAPFRVWYFGWRGHSEYSPTRLYYRFRNFVALVRLPHVPWRWSLRASWYWLGNLYAHCFYARDKLRNARAIARGLWDGLLGRSGMLQRRL